MYENECHLTSFLDEVDNMLLFRLFQCRKEGKTLIFCGQTIKYAGVLSVDSFLTVDVLSLSVGQHRKCQKNIQQATVWFNHVQQSFSQLDDGRKYMSRICICSDFYAFYICSLNAKHAILILGIDGVPVCLLPLSYWPE